jgi:hypothetical protein
MYRILFLYKSKVAAYVKKYTKYIVTNSQVLFHDGTLLHSKFNTQLLITISNSSRILTHGTYPGSVIQILITTLKTRPTASPVTTNASTPFCFQLWTDVHLKSLTYLSLSRIHSNACVLLCNICFIVTSSVWIVISKHLLIYIVKWQLLSRI